MKPTILITNAYYLPGYRGGGPIRTLANMVERMSDEFDFRIVAKDRDLGDQQPYEGIQVDAWNLVGKAQVFYASPAMQSLSAFACLLRETPYDVLYLNSFFNPIFTFQPMLARWLGLAPKHPVVIAPRGEFSDGSFNLKRWKKAPFTRLTMALGIFSDVMWHASTPFEATDIQRILRINPRRIHVARNITLHSSLIHPADLMINETESQSSQGNSPLKICFLSRISPEKNLSYAIKALAKVRVPVQFNVYGPLESSNYWAECEALISKLPSHIQVTYCGGVEHSKVQTVISQHDLFFVPSRGENFGHVYMEAWSAGVPVLVSDRTPWHGLEELRVGWDCPLEEPERFIDAIEQVASWSEEHFLEVRANCLSFSRKQTADPQAYLDNRTLFLDAMESTRTRLHRNTAAEHHR